MTKQPWLRILLIALLAIVVLGAVGVAAYRLGFQSGLSQQIGANSAGLPPRFGGPEGGQWFGFRGGFPMTRVFTHMRPGFGGFGFWFHPGFLIGLLILALLVFLIVKAVSPRLPEPRPRRQRS